MRLGRPSRAAARRVPAAGPSPLRFVVGMGVVSLLGDVVYEGARSVTGPFLASLGASAALVGILSGAGEGVAFVFRLGAGVLADRTRRYWTITIAGYALTAVSVPLLGLAGAVGVAGALVIAERLGKAVRTPARDTMLSQAGASIGRGYSFALHEALDQGGAVAGPLLVALVLALTGSFHTAFALLAIPGAAMLVLLLRLRRTSPETAVYEPEPAESSAASGGVPSAMRRYALFTALSVAGFATFAVLAYHLQVRHVVPTAQIPLIYALAMAVDAGAALLSGRMYDRSGLRVLAAVPLLTAAVPFFSFSTAPALVWLGAALWGAAMGMQESTMRAAVADLVPVARRGTAYGAFNAVYGLAWLAGGAAIGVLYGQSIAAATAFIVGMEALAVLAFAGIWRGR